MPAAADLRLLVWLLVGLLVLSSAPLAPLPLTIALLPAMLALVLLWGARGEKAAAAVGAALSRGAVRAGVLVLAAVVTAAGVVLGPLAGLMLATWVLLILLVVAVWRGSEAMAEATLAGAMLAVTVAIALGLCETFLNRSSLGARLGVPRVQRQWDAHYDSLWTRNVLGHRTRHGQMGRTPGVRRILALGDSYTWGDKIASSDSTWPALLEQRLGSAQNEVWNLGQRGWTTANEAEMLDRFGWQLSPDIVVVQWFANDALPSGPGFAREGEAWRGLLPARFRRYPAGNSATVYLLERVLNQLLRSGEGGGGYASLYTPHATGWTQLRAALRDMGDSAQRRGVPVLLVLYPAFVPGEWTREGYPLRAIHDSVAASAREAGLDVLDLSDVFAREGGDWRRWWALPWDHHPNVAAHQAAAAAIADRIGQASPPSPR